MVNLPIKRWQFWIDRGGTFTDIVAQRPDGQIVIHKLLSENPERYDDAPLQGIRDILGIASHEPLPIDQIEVIKMGTTVATNALLERQGDRTVLVITQGFGDALRIGYQNRPDIFARHIVLPEMLYEQVIEVPVRHSAQGEELLPWTPEITENLRSQLQTAYDKGIRSCAIVLMHSYRYPAHEQLAVAIATALGFPQISASHQVSPLIKLISRGDTTVLDAYLSPILHRYIHHLTTTLSPSSPSPLSPSPTPSLLFMQSHGGLTPAHRFQGKDSILSGPAGGMVGAVETSQRAGYTKIIGFDMGGTSTDVSHFNGEYERTFETEVAGVHLRTPMLAIHTVAAGGGSILSFDGNRYRVGPASAGAHPGPACYRKGGPLTVTDCNVMVGKVQPAFFPAVFGASGDQPLDQSVVQTQFADLAQEIAQATGDQCSSEEVAVGFLAIAIEKMANAIKKISVQRGYDVSDYVLCCFGGAGGQHACLIAEALGIKEIFLHPYAGVLSAYGMGLADQRLLLERSLEVPLTATIWPTLEAHFNELANEVSNQLTTELATGTPTELAQQKITLPADNDLQTHSQLPTLIAKVHLRYAGTDSAIPITFTDLTTLRQTFATLHQQRYGFTLPQRDLVVEAISMEAVIKQPIPVEPLPVQTRQTPLTVATTVQMYSGDRWQTTPVYQRADLVPADHILGPALITEATSTIVIEPSWQAHLTPQNHLILTPQTSTPVSSPPQKQIPASTPAAATPNPITLEIFNNLFRTIAEEMGITLQNTSYSVNIKERLDFSCALFDQQGYLVANAPHIPVHLGSMGESVQGLIQAKGSLLKPGDVYAMNNPYAGGTHLPDVTVITPVFIEQQPLFYLASRGHHADIGGISPGSMPADSTSITEEGVLIDYFLLVKQGEFREQALLDLLTSTPYPVRNPVQTIADLQAQIAANAKGQQSLLQTINQYGLQLVQAYMQHVQNNAEASVRKAIDQLCQQLDAEHRPHSCQFTYPLDNGSQIQVEIKLNAETSSAVIDFTGTSPQQVNNFNTPVAVGKAAVLYVFRTLVADDIPLNAGCLKPLEIIIPTGSMLNPEFPAAVVAGNVETSQAITNALYGALGIMAAAQGTMNNFTFGNQQYQYYETICGGSGAGPTFDGTDAIQTHMTNSRLTDPEVLEWRFPVILQRFQIRHGSGGAGHHPGGAGVIRQIQFRQAMTATILSGHRQIPPFGLAGGESGQVGFNYLIHPDGTITSLKGQDTVFVEPGDAIVIETPGGGGYGQFSADYHPKTALI